MRRNKILWLGLGDVSLQEIFKFTFEKPFVTKRKCKVEQIIKHDRFCEVKYEGFEYSIFWTQNHNINDLYQVAAEILYKNWWKLYIASNRTFIKGIVPEYNIAEIGIEPRFWHPYHAICLDLVFTNL